MTETKECLCAVLQGQADSEERADACARNSRACPYAAAYIATGRLVVGVFVLPTDKRWWLEVPQAHPELLGLQEVNVHFLDAPLTSSAWSRGEVTPTLESAPCGTACNGCPWYRQPCQGCPATVFFVERS